VILDDESMTWDTRHDLFELSIRGVDCFICFGAGNFGLACLVCLSKEVQDSQLNIDLSFINYIEEDSYDGGIVENLGAVGYSPLYVFNPNCLLQSGCCSQR
jgi:hypothetical protein